VDPGAAIGANVFPSNPVREGYEFAGWYTQEDGKGSVFHAAFPVNHSMTVYAHWVGVPPHKAAVIFRLNDGTESVLTVKAVAPGKSSGADFPAQPARTGYNFGGWFLTPDGIGAFNPADTVVADKTVYAKWEIQTFNVIFNNTNGETPYSKSVRYGDAIGEEGAFPSNPVWTGHVFAGWNTRTGGTGTLFTASTVVTAGINVYAQWITEPDYAVFKLNDGTENLLVIPVSPGNAVGADFPVNPGRADYDFTGWNTHQDGSGDAFTASTAVDVNIEVYAQWEGKPYTVTFVRNWAADDAAVPMILTTKTVIFPAAIGEDFAPASESGDYFFTNWNTQAKGLGTVFDSGTAVNGNIWVYAQWMGVTYTITFNKYGGDTDADPPSKTVTAPNTLGDLPAPPTKTGYIFAGWNTEPDGMGTVVTRTTAVHATMTVYAQWTHHIAEGGTFTLTAVEGESSKTWEIHTFTESGTLTFPPGYTSVTADYLIVAGGGGAGGDLNSISAYDFAGGGGAGGLLYKTGQTLSLTDNALAVTVGGGGEGGATRTQGAYGGDSAIGDVKVPRGGGGGGSSANMNGNAGGSGGGGGAGPGKGRGGGGQRINNSQYKEWLGNPGGAGNRSNDFGSGGSGGGAGSAGKEGINNGNVVAGGNPWNATAAGASWIVDATKTAEFPDGVNEFARGGNSGGNNAPAGGATGVNYGDGGSGSNNTVQKGGAGHSGIVVIRFLCDL
jgi:uncharacterized repeat protein (TIGR02543 family)